MTGTQVHRNARASLDRPAATAVIAALAGLAWLVLWAWGRSPYGRYLAHDDAVQASVGALPVFVAGWTLMTVAMMLPTSLPLVRLFDRVIAGRTDHRRLVALLVVGYLGTWAAVGTLVHAGDRVIHRVVDATPAVAGRPWIVGAATLLLAGGYQFSSLKYRCLDKCRSPLLFVAEHWTGRARSQQALRLGVRHGLFCVGCCWTLMLLMFAVGVGSIVWMLGLATIMAIEKNAPSGRRLGKPLGVALVFAGCLVTVAHAA